MKKVYLDANILITYAVGPEKDDKFDLAKQVFDKIKSGEYEGVISTLTLMEVLGVFRRHIGTDRQRMYSVPRDTQGEYVQTESQSMFQSMLGELVKMGNIKFEDGKSVDLASVLNPSLDIMKEVKGIVKFYNTCGICNSQARVSVHKAVATMDIIHTTIAKETGCESLITFDKGFKELQGNDSLNPLEIEVLEI